MPFRCMMLLNQTIAIRVAVRVVRRSEAGRRAMMKLGARNIDYKMRESIGELCDEE